MTTQNKSIIIIIIICYLQKKSYLTYKYYGHTAFKEGNIGSFKYRKLYTV